METAFNKGDRVKWHKNEDTGPVWAVHDGQEATVDEKYSFAEHGVTVRIVFDGERKVSLARVTSLTLVKAKVPTLHDQAREQFELAMMYGEDGAFASAATILEDIALTYRRRANAIAAELNQGMPANRPRGLKAGEPKLPYGYED